MNKIKDLYCKFESIVANVKFAVVIISLFAVSLVVGTFMESWHGTDYANRIVYKSWWFILIEICMFLSIFMATVVRLPAKKRLYGFYTIHAGLIILFVGSFFTYINGIDGSIQLLPNTPAHKILINEDILKITFPGRKKAYKLALPYSYTPRKLSNEINGVKILEFLPYAKKKLAWVEQKKGNSQQHSSTYLLFNENFGQDVTLSLSPKSDFKSMSRMGLLDLHYMPSLLADCFAKKSKTGFMIWNLQNGECFVPEDKKLKTGETKKGNRFLLIKHNNEFIKFFPDFSPVAVNDDLTKREDTPYRVLSKKVFQDRPNLFLFGEKVGFYRKGLKKWAMKDLNKGVVSLPWMNFKLRLLDHRILAYPVEVPIYTKPIQERGNLIEGDTKAVKIAFHNKEYWVRNDAALELSNGMERVRFQIQPKEINLPYQITLDHFKMNKNPGTNDPASYESFVQLLDSRTNGKVENHHVYMNHPLKYDDFTFYQSSYFPIGPQEFGSVLSVNYDPGRFFKYLGSLFIVLGSIWHYLINRRKKVSV